MIGNYESKDIRVMSEIEHIRLRPGMYIGEATTPYQLLSEMIDNSVDEAVLNPKTKIEIYIDNENHMYSVRDYGRGIPIGLKNIKGKDIETVEVVCSLSHSGGKFDHSNYNASSGLHGVGLCCCNALSNKFSISTYRNGKSATYNSEKGQKVGEVIYSDTKEKDGVYTSIVADDTIFDSIDIPLDLIIKRCNMIKAFGYNLHLYIKNDKNKFEEYDLGVKKFNDLIKNKDKVSKYYEDYFEVEDSKGQKLLVGLEYTSDLSYSIEGYSNMTYNPYGGTHVSQLEKSIIQTWEYFRKDIDKYISVKLSGNDFLVGLKSVVAVFLEEVSFSSQTKEKLTSNRKDMKELMNNFVNKFWKKLNKDVELRHSLLKRFEEVKLAKEKVSSRSEILSMIKIADRSDNSKVHRKSIVHKLSECTSSDRAGTELYVCEGDSASGTIARARDRRIQAVLPLRGKIKNTTYMKSVDALKSEEVRNIVNSVGAGYGSETYPEKSRYEKIIIATDRDVDGSHIASLIISLFVNHMPKIVEESMLYLLDAPLYAYDKGKERIYTSNFEEIPKENLKNHTFTRFKGLGEMDDSEFRESCLQEGKRILYRITYPHDLDRFNRILDTSSGRRELLINEGIIVKERS